MNKNRSTLISLIALLAIILVACQTGDIGGQPDSEDAVGVGVVATESSPTEEVPFAQPVDTQAPPPPPTEDVTPKQPEELPSIPVVQFGPGSDWFRPTPPGEIQLASGGIQLFEFSAVW